MSYDGLKKLQNGERRKYHDDITVVVLFIDHEMWEEGISVQELSMRGFVDTIGPSSFSSLRGIMAESSPLSK
uniref:Uncharacterized protein n=1 Tax=Rhizophora mucronata TaxID=61149 RepID=A0A2P2NQW2_RHIMU